AEAQVLVRYDQVDIEADCVTEALAGRASPKRIVEAEQPRFRGRIYDRAVLALESFGVAGSPGWFTSRLDPGGPCPRAFDYYLAMAFLIADLNRVNEASAAVLTYLKAVYQDKSFIEVVAGKVIGSGQVDRGAVPIEASKAALHQAHEMGLDFGGGTGRSLFLFCDARAAKVRVSVGDAGGGGEHHIESSALGQSERLVGDGFRRVAADEPAAVVAKSESDPGKQEPEVVVDLGLSSDSRSGVPGRVFLTDGNRRAYAKDFVNVRTVHSFQELTRIGGETLDVAALAL